MLGGSDFLILAFVLLGVRGLGRLGFWAGWLGSGKVGAGLEFGVASAWGGEVLKFWPGEVPKRTGSCQKSFPAKEL